MNLQEQIFHEMMGEDSYDDRVDSERIVSNYKAMSEEDRTRMDDIFISLTGWRLTTLLEQAELI